MKTEWYGSKKVASQARAEGRVGQAEKRKLEEQGRKIEREAGDRSFWPPMSPTQPCWHLEQKLLLGSKRATSTSAYRHQSLRPARLQNETAPPNNFKSIRKWFEKREKWSGTCPKNFKPFSCRLNVFHRHFSKSFHLPESALKKLFFTARLCRGSYANNRCIPCDMHENISNIVRDNSCSFSPHQVGWQTIVTVIFLQDYRPWIKRNGFESHG